MDKSLLYKNRIAISIFIFASLLFLIHTFKPSIIYDDDGSFLQLGVGYTNKTIFPIWLISIALALLCYIGVMTFIYLF
jgi:hypothetical protein